MTKTKDNAKTVRLLLAATFLFWFSVYTYPSFLSAYAQEDLNASAMMLGLITGSYGFTQMLLRIPLGIGSDLLKKRKPFLVAGMVASIAAAAGLTLVKNAWGALVFRGLSGVAASTWVTYSVMYSSCFETDEIPGAISRLSFYQYASQVFAMLLGAYLADAIDKRAAFLLAAAAGVAGVIVTICIRDLPPTGEPQTLKAFANVLRDKSLLTSTALSVLFHFICWGTVLGFTVNWAKGVIGMTTAQLGFLSATYLLPNTLMARMTGTLSKRLGSRTIMTSGFCLIGVACLLYGRTEAVWQLFAVQALFGCGMGLIMPLTMSGAIANIPVERRGAAMGFYQSIYGLGMFLGPVIAGAVVASRAAGENMKPGYQANFLMMAAVALVGAAASYLLNKPERRKS